MFAGRSPARTIPDKRSRQAPELWQQWRNILSGRAMDNAEIDAETRVNQTTAHGDDQLSRNAVRQTAPTLGYVAAGFVQNLQIADAIRPSVLAPPRGSCSSVT